MALIESNPFELGKKAPDFNLPDVLSNSQKSLSELKGEKATVIMFICNHCPFVLHVNDGLVKLANKYIGKGISFIAISSNDAIQYPQDGPEQMKAVALALNYPFPYLYDQSQEIAKAYDATCTPDFYVFDHNLKSIYHGQLDDSRPGNGLPVTGSFIQKAIEHLLAGKGEKVLQKPSIGCSIKWK
ncbi:MAG: peroxiredoxin [Limisphaerales bacterium]|jgi:peroxiredoxin